MKSNSITRERINSIIQKFSIPALGLSIILSLLPVAGSAQTTGDAETGQSDQAEYSGPAYIYPRTPRPKFNTRVNRYLIDGIHGKEMLIISPEFTFSTDLSTAWSQMSDRYSSLRFSFRGDPRVTYAISLFGEEEFLPDLSDESIQGYLSGLKRSYPRRVTILNEKEGFLGGRDASYILGSRVRLVKWELLSKDKKSKILYYDYFIKFKGRLIMGRLNGPEEKFHLAYRSFIYLFSNMYEVETQN